MSFKKIRKNLLFILVLIFSFGFEIFLYCIFLNNGINIFDYKKFFALQLLIGGVVLILFGLNQDDVRIPVIMSIIFLFLGNTAANFLLEQNGKIISAKYAVGLANFIGYSKPQEFKTFFITTIIALGMAMTFYFISLLKSKSHLSQSNKIRSLKNIDYNKPHRKNISILLLISLLSFFVLVRFPPLRDFYDDIANFKHDLRYDDLNGLTWGYSSFMGWLPFKDIWISWAGFYDWAFPFPWGELKEALYLFFLMSILLVSIHILVNRSKLWTTIIFFTLIFMIETGYVDACTRSFVPLSIILFFLALTRLKTKPIYGYLIFGIITGYGFTFEPIKVFFAFFPILVLSLVHFIRLKERQERIKFIKYLVTAGAVSTAYIASYLFILAYRNQLTGFFEFYKNIGLMAIYSSIPTYLGEWYHLRFDYNNILLISIHIFIMVGFYLILTKKGNTESGDIIFAIGLLGIMQFQKHLIRPHIALQIMPIFLVGGMLWIYHWSREWNIIQKGTGVFILGILSAYIISYGYVNWWPRLIGLPNRFEDIKVLFSDRKDLNNRLENFYFSIENYSNNDVKTLKKIRGIYNNFSLRKSNPKIFVLGDDSFFYILLKQKPPEYISFYDASPLLAQKKLLKWFDSEKPDLVIWDPQFKQFDGVPNLVRVPLIYNYVIHNYRYHTHAGKYQILERIDNVNDIDISYWKQYLDDSVNLGYIPAISGAAESEHHYVKANTTINSEFLEIEDVNHISTIQKSIKFNIAEQTFYVNFNIKKGLEKYYIYLDRLWFWSVAKAKNIPVNICMDKDMNFNIVQKRLEDAILY